MQRRDVAEPDEPLGILGYVVGRKIFEQMHHTVSAAAAQNGFHLGVVQRFEEVGKALLDGA